jgi:His/Glu/Gln/Arg/opine family amino acid ABC transporter permease subunit
MDAFLTVIRNALPTLLWGALLTLQLTMFAAVFGMLGGSAIGIARRSRFQILRLLARMYTDFFRGTPLLVQLFMVYFGLPAVLQSIGLPVRFDRFFAGVLALSLNVAAYVAEIVRGSLQSIEYGQTEAARSLGLSPWQTLRHVIFPQAFRRMIAPLGNEFSTLLKDTSLVAIIGYEELFRRGQLIVADTYRSFEVYTAVAVVYLVMTVAASQVFSYLERRFDPLDDLRSVEDHRG